MRLCSSPAKKLLIILLNWSTTRSNSNKMQKNSLTKYLTTFPYGGYSFYEYINFINLLKIVYIVCIPMEIAGIVFQILCYMPMERGITFFFGSIRGGSTGAVYVSESTLNTYRYTSLIFLIFTHILSFSALVILCLSVAKRIKTRPQFCLKSGVIVINLKVFTILVAYNVYVAMTSAFTWTGIMIIMAFVLALIELCLLNSVVYVYAIQSLGVQYNRRSTLGRSFGRKTENLPNSRMKQNARFAEPLQNFEENPSFTRYENNTEFQQEPRRFTKRRVSTKSSSESVKIVVPMESVADPVQKAEIQPADDFERSRANVEKPDLRLPSVSPKVAPKQAVKIDAPESPEGADVPKKKRVKVKRKKTQGHEELKKALRESKKVGKNNANIKNHQDKK
ncbi:uncharacterized protein LOC142340597 isoform X1 [Convolutriloba macropyga]|uniref:uncharacterized protein LOC142340597 isoform X1 n=1 Tax=Convolutriloba macropyga TaxID=536237 RepID=UPI003F523B2D